MCLNAPVKVDEHYIVAKVDLRLLGKHTLQFKVIKESVKDEAGTDQVRPRPCGRQLSIRWSVDNKGAVCRARCVRTVDGCLKGTKYKRDIKDGWRNVG